MGRGWGLLLDVDGTVYRGRAALEAYASALVRCAPAAFAGPLERAMADGLAGGGPLTGCRDVWTGLTHLARRAGVTPRQADAAFEEVRARIVAGRIPVEVPAGLARFLDRVEGHAQVAFGTNSAGASAADLLASLGILAGRAVAGAAHKPAGMEALRRRLFGHLPAERIVSVGDNYLGDVAGARLLGMRGVHVAWPGAMRGPADLAVAHLEEAFPWLLGLMVPEEVA